MTSYILTISVPSGGKVAELHEDLKRKGKNVSQTVCAILERHAALYDDNVHMEMELNELRWKYGQVCNAARDALAQGGEEWELYFPPRSSVDYVARHGDGGYGLGARIHFRKVEPDQSSSG